MNNLWKGSAVQQEPQKGSAVDNYRPLSCLPMMWKLMTGMLAENIYSHPERENVLQSEQKECRKKIGGPTGIEKTVLRDGKRRQIDLALTWIDHKRAYDMVPHSWISECFQMFGIPNNVQNFLNNRIKS